MKKRQLFIYICIFTIGVCIPIVLHDASTLFGSTTDYVNQHIQIAKAIRQAVYQQGFFPNFMDSLGAGQNIYNFAYYGLFRLDILISLLLPNVDMYTIISTYMICMYAISLCLFYELLKEHQLTDSIACIMVLLFALSSYSFQMHRQILFVNYLPFLLVSMLVIKKGKSQLWLVLLFACIILHSFFFSLSCAVVLAIYTLYLNHDKPIKQIFILGLHIGFAYLLCSFYLLPTGLAILANSRSDAVIASIAPIDLSFSTILYDKYGMGLTFISLFSLFLALRSKQLRILAIVLLVLFSIPICSYILNFALYVRPKAFIPFIPLVLLVTGLVIQQISKHEISWKAYDVLFIVLVIVASKSPTLVAMDALVTISILLCIYYQKQALFANAALLAAIITCQVNNQYETYEKKTNYQKLTSLENNPDIHALDLENYRFEDLRFVSTSVNTASPKLKRTSMYTSINNSAYNTFFYDVMMQAIPSRNRVITSYQHNPVFAKLMGIRYLYTTKKYVPIGYEVYAETKDYKILENKEVRPIAYGTSKLLHTDVFEKLSAVEKLQALQSYLITDNTSNQTYENKVQSVAFQPTFTKQNTSLQLEMKNDTLLVQAKKKASVDLTLEQDIKGILVIEFDVEDISNLAKQDMYIDIQGVRNKLSSLHAAYPNHNTHFTYTLSDAKELKKLHLTFSEGNYKLTNIQLHQFEDVSIDQLHLDTFTQIESDAVLEGTITMQEDGMFATSLPMQDGFQLYVDGKKQAIETVNTTFVGTKLSKGSHTVKVIYTPPGKPLGFLISGCMFIILCLKGVWERRTYVQHRQTTH